MSGKEFDRLSRDDLAEMLMKTIETCVRNIQGDTNREAPARDDKNDRLGKIPQSDGVEATDDWMTILKPIQQDDKDQCDLWKEEIQNTLIFAALFSAVVTAFLIESYKLLQRDTTDSSSSPANATALETLLNPSDRPTTSSISINIFWFLSLVLSLTTALIGIVSTQWLREHLSYPEYLTPEQTFALLNMKTEMLQKWRVRAIVASLPILLQASLLLFFAGLAQFLVSLGVKQVTIPVVLVISLSLIFPIATTILPTLQIYLLHKETQLTASVPVPCPYKSPQAEILYSISFILSNYSPIRFTFSMFYAAVLRVLKAVRYVFKKLFYASRKAFRAAKEYIVDTWTAIICSVKDSTLPLVVKMRYVVGSLVKAAHFRDDRSRVHYTHGISRFRNAMQQVNEIWWSFDLAWVSIRRDYAHRIHTNRQFERSVNTGTIHVQADDIVNAWREQDTTGSWEKAWQYGPPYDQIQGLRNLSRLYQYDDSSDQSMMEATYRCFKQSLDSYSEQRSSSTAETGSRAIEWDDIFYTSLVEMLRPRNSSIISDVATISDASETPVQLRNRMFRGEALFLFLAEMKLDKTPCEVSIQETWAQIYFELLHSFYQGLWDLKTIPLDAPLYFTKQSNYFRTSVVSRLAPSIQEELAEKDREYAASVFQNVAKPDAMECISYQDLRLIVRKFVLESPAMFFLSLSPRATISSMRKASSRYRKRPTCAPLTDLEVLEKEVFRCFNAASALLEALRSQESHKGEVEELGYLLYTFCTYLFEQEEDPRSCKLRQRIEYSTTDTLENLQSAYLDDAFGYIFNNSLAHDPDLDSSENDTPTDNSETVETAGLIPPQNSEAQSLSSFRNPDADNNV